MEKAITFIRDNPLDAVFDFDEDPEVEFTTYLVNCDSPYLIQIDTRMAHLLLLTETHTHKTFSFMQDFLRQQGFWCRSLHSEERDFLEVETYFGDLNKIVSW